MRRSLCLALLALPVALLFVRADEKSDRADRWKQILARYKEQEAELTKTSTTAADPDDRKAALVELKELNAITADKALDFAESDPKDDLGLEATTFALQKLAKFGITGESIDKAVKIVADHHLANPKLKPVLADLRGAGKAGAKLLEGVADKATDPETKAIATYYWGVSFLDRADEANPQAATELVKDGKKLLATAVKLAPNAAVDGTTIEKAAAIAVQIPVVGNPAPDVTGSDLDDKKVKLSSYQGKVVLLDIWATWCGPCRAMIPHERELVKSMKDKPFVLLSVSCDDAKTDLTEFLKEEKMPWDHWFDGRGGAVSKAYKIKAFPTLYLIDAKGVIRQKWVGSPKADVLDKAVEELVKEAKK